MAENCTFRLVMPDGRSRVLRIHRPGYHTLPELESELIWTGALRDAGIKVPVGRRTLDGHGYITISHTGRKFFARGWIGPIGSTATSFSGRLSANPIPPGSRLVLSRSDASPPGFTISPAIGGRRRNLSVTLSTCPVSSANLPFWGRFWELPALNPGQGAILTRARDGIEAILGDYGRDPAVFSMIHADLHPKNLRCQRIGRSARHRFR